MTLKTSLVALAGALAFGLMGAPAQAAPLGSMGDVRTNAAHNSDVQDVRWYRRCYWHRGHRHCRRYWDDDYGYYYDGYPYGPGIGFFFGGGGHGHHFRGHRGGHHFRGHGGGRHGHGRRH